MSKRTHRCDILDFLEYVPKDTFLGKVVSPYNHDMLEERKASYNESAMIHVGAVSSADPGDRVHVIGNAELGEWIRNTQLRV